jgi:hypothetical protein
VSSKRGTVATMTSMALMGLTLPAHAESNQQPDFKDYTPQDECVYLGGTVEDSNCVFPDGTTRVILP